MADTMMMISVVVLLTYCWWC